MGLRITHKCEFVERELSCFVSGKEMKNRWSVMEAVLSNPDLVAHILSGTIGPSTYFSASLVGKAWLVACRSNETLLRLVALYQGGLTRTMFTRLFALTQKEVLAMPHTVRRRPLGGVYYIYGAEAVECVVSDDGFAQWHVRISNRPAPRWGIATSHWQVEDRLHNRATRMFK